MGYDPTFITGETVPLPTLCARLKATALNNGDPVTHSRYTLVFSETRNLSIFTAHNIDGATLGNFAIDRKDRFRFDPTIPNHLQVDNDRGYRNNPWDRGHLVKRASLHWGDDEAAARLGDSESYFWSNISPQHHKLHDTAWGNIEDWMVDDITAGQKRRACVFTGPIFGADDAAIENMPGETPIQIPAGFWKVLVVKIEGVLKAAGFLVWQRDFEDETPITFSPHLEQIRLTTLEHLTGICFGDLRKADPLLFTAGSDEESPFESAPPQPKAGGVIRGRADIIL